MYNIRKYLIISILIIILTIPMFFKIYVGFFFIRDFTFQLILIVTVGFLIFFLLGKLFEKYGYDNNSIELMKQHDVIDALINKKNKVVLWAFFPLTIIMEELIFRYYSMGLLLNQFDLDQISAILISSIIFSFYHFHFWFKMKSFRILLIYLGFSFFLGLFIAYILLNLGIIFCIVIHYSLAFKLYVDLSKKVLKMNKR